MLNTIRFGLIGGGEKPNIAASLARVYAAERPINEALPIAVAILETAFFGKPSRQELAVMALIKKLCAPAATLRSTTPCCFTSPSQFSPAATDKLASASAFTGQAPDAGID